MTIPGKIPNWLRSRLEKAGDALGLKSDLDMHWYSIDNSFIETGGTISRNVTIDSDEKIYHQLSTGSSLTINGSITIDGNLQVYEL